MTAPTNGHSRGPYKVVGSELFRQQVRIAFAKALAAGTGQAFHAALRKIWEHLRSDPLAFGEPKYRLPALKLQVRQGGVHRIVVHYAVHEDRPLVFVSWFNVLS